MSDKKKNFLDHVNKKNNKKVEKESFKEEKFVHAKKSRLPLVVMIIVSVALLVMIWSFQNRKIVVEDLSNLTLVEASTWAEDNDLILSSIEVFSNVETERVVAQNVEPGTEVSKGAILKIDVSKGSDPYEKIEIPDFDGTWSRNSIVVWLEENGMENFSFVDVVNDEVEEDFLIEYRLIGATAETFNRRSEIEFTIREVVDTAAIEVPSFINSTITSLDTWAKNNDIEYSYEYAYDEFYEEDRIFQQSVMAGQNMDTTETLTVKISKGQEAVPVEMITLINMNLSDAEAWLKSNKVNYRLRYSYSTVYGENKVINQSHVLGDVVNEEKVELTVSLGESIKVPDFSEMTLLEANNFASMYPSNFVIQSIYDTAEAGGLIRQSVKADKYMKVDKKVQVVYSLGQKALVPNFRNQTAYDVQAWIDQQNDMGASIGIKIVEVPSSNIVVGKVISQSNHLGEIAIDGVLKIQVSKGLKVPDFSLMTKAQATTYKGEDVIEITVVERYSIDVEQGKLISQTIPKDTLVNDDEHLVVTYSLGNELAVASYINQPLVTLETWIKAQNELGASIALTTEEHFSNKVTYGKIISQSIFNKHVAIDSQIDVIVSKGVGYVVPDFERHIKISIEQIATAENLKIVYLYVDSDKPLPDLFVGQNPPAGTVISKNDVIYVELSK